MTKKRVKLVKNVRTPKQRSKEILERVQPEIGRVLVRHQNLRNLATDGWSSRNKPNFPMFIKQRGGRLSFGVRVVAPKAEQASISVYRMLNNRRHGRLATRVRRVMLVSGYQRKTLPRRFGNFGKGGGIRRTRGGSPVFRDTSQHPNGIEAREWDEMANDILEPEMTTAIKRGIRYGFRNL